MKEFAKKCKEESIEESAKNLTPVYEDINKNYKYTEELVSGSVKETEIKTDNKISKIYEDFTKVYKYINACKDESNGLTKDCTDKIYTYLSEVQEDLKKVILESTREAKIEAYNNCEKLRNDVIEVQNKKFEEKEAEFKNIFAENLVSNMKNTSSMAEIRKFTSTIDSLLFSSNIPKSVVDSLYKVINKNLNVYQKYLKLIKNSLGLKELAYYDLNAQILTDEMSFSIEDAQYLIGEATKIYGEEYHDIIEKAFEEKWVDYCSYKGKASGAYCTSCYGAHPVVLTNFFGKFGDVSAVAHELGHAVNFYLSQQANNKHDYNNDIFVAEVASLTNEIILSNYVIEHSRNKNLKLIALYNLINLIQNNLFDACLEGELENKAYTLIDNGETIDAEYLSNTIYDIRSKYYKDVVNLDDKSKYSWIRREHYFYPFYLFKYATGVSAAIMIATKIINNEDDMKNKYISFLKMGDTDYPVELLKKIGIDMTKEEVYENAVNFFSNLIDEFDKESDK